MIRTVLIAFFCISGIAAAQSSFSSERLKSAVVHFVQKQCDEDTECIVSSSITAQKFTEENVIARCSASEKSLRGSTNIAVEFLIDEKVIRRIHIPVIIKRYAIVPVAIEQISQRAEIDEQKISFEKREISSFVSEDFPTEEEIIGASARRNIGKNSIITQAMLLSHNSVKRGAGVVIYATISGVSIKSRGTALTDADEGQSVRVMREGTNEPILCTVSGFNEVRIQQ